MDLAYLLNPQILSPNPFSTFCDEPTVIQVDEIFLSLIMMMSVLVQSVWQEMKKNNASIQASSSSNLLSGLYQIELPAST